MIADRIKLLRQENDMTQSDLARILGITRSSVNAWEMGISVPSTQYIIEMSRIFHVSTDYIMDVDTYATLSIKGLDDDEIRMVHALIEHFRNKPRK
ncbi:MAG: helix-turn-helix transcriptional regulator [Firmicutes bacterium]|nr:helix-turn-helix transcriptional regulator [Bacillota bacterium]MDY6174707.1 helix-turn-helix transcriptional regulator [Lentihominibacter sp.]